MTIKEIKQQYETYDLNDGINKFKTFNFGGEYGRCVIIVNFGGYGCKDVTQVIRVSDGKPMLAEGRCRPCDNLDDAVDVAWEMLCDNDDYTPEGSREWIHDLFIDWKRHHNE